MRHDVRGVEVRGTTYARCICFVLFDGLIKTAPFTSVELSVLLLRGYLVSATDSIPNGPKPAGNAPRGASLFEPVTSCWSQTVGQCCAGPQITTEAGERG